MAGSPVAIDIETVGMPFEELDPLLGESFLRHVPPEKVEEAKQKTVFHPATAHVVAIGLWRPEEERGGVLVWGEGGRGWEPFPDFPGEAQIYRGSEEEILRAFWRFMAGTGASTIITYNGRQFDGPMLMLRSLLLGIEPTRNLVPYRYSFKEHCDLMEVITFYGARRPPHSLDFWCRAFGIESPKEEMSGEEVARAFAEGRMDDIARYCLTDARATAHLYLRLKPLVDLLDSRS